MTFDKKKNLNPHDLIREKFRRDSFVPNDLRQSIRKILCWYVHALFLRKS